MHIVSLLGHKKDGYSEFEYYPFRSSQESSPKPTFQEWLDQRYGVRFVVHEFPTVDAMGIPKGVLTAVITRVRELLETENTVVIDRFSGSRTNRKSMRGNGRQEMPLRYIWRAERVAARNAS
jgi:hypothetical protein